MLFVNFTAANKEYRLRLDTQNIIALEKLIGCNPLAIFGNDGERLPTITEMVNILYCSLQPLNHGISLKDTFDIFDNYLSDNHSATDFIPVIMEVYKASGIIKGSEVKATVDGEQLTSGEDEKN